MNTDNSNGRRWARFTLVVTLFVSVVANITHAALADSVITLWLRVPGASIWPLLSFLAIEIIVRVQWERRWAHGLARAFILGPAIPAVIVSYEHQERLLRMMGESGIVSAIGPLAIDGLMIGCTLALLFTRPAIVAESAPVAELAPVAEPTPAVEPAIEPAPVEDAPRPVRPARDRAPRRGGENTAKAIEALKDGLTPALAAERSGLSVPAVRKYRQVMTILRDNPNASIDTRAMSVRVDAVDSIRAWARLESVR